MDKYEYNLKLEEITKLADQGYYEDAADIILFYSTITLHVFKVYYTKNTLSNRGFSQFFRLTGSFSPEISKKEAAVFLRLPDTLIWSYRF